MPHTLLSAGARRLIALFVCLLFANSSFAAAPATPSGTDKHALWSVKGKHNTVYVLGSLHLLPPDEQLPNVMDAAYRDAKKLVMEIDLDDLSPLAMQKAMTDLGLLPAGETLTQTIGPELAEKVTAYTKELGVQPSMLEPFRPWMAAIMLTQFQFMKMGLDPGSGVEQRFVARATTDHKEILGLETLDEQLRLLAGLPPQLQKQFLLQTIADADRAEQEIGALLQAWRIGDADALARTNTEAMKDFPELYGPLTVDRNKRWMSRLEKMLGESQNYLVIVGTLHLVGKDGVLDLLKKKGFAIEQR